MTWTIDTGTQTARHTNGLVVRFAPDTGQARPRGPFVIARGLDDDPWIGAPQRSPNLSEADRLRLLHEAADAFAAALRGNVDPFPSDG